MIIRSRAPLRISFCGGGTDVQPYPQKYGGVVLSGTINRYTYCSLVPDSTTQLKVHSLDYQRSAAFGLHEALPFDGDLDIFKAVFRRLPVRNGLKLFVHSDAPPGSGLGSSSALVVALIGALWHLLHRHRDNYEIADLAYRMEREDLGIKGGMQDQYSAAFGGFNFIEFSRDGVIVNPLRLSGDVVCELEYHLLLVYTGKTRLSGNIVGRQIDAYEREDPKVMDALLTIKGLTVAMKNALVRGRLQEFGATLHEAWVAKKQLDGGIATPQVDTLYEEARRLGALGGKILGAGGGGHMLLFVPYTHKHDVAQRMISLGAEVVPFAFEQHGLHSWQVEDTPEGA